LLRAILQNVRDAIPLARISAKFHNTLVDVILEVARRSPEQRIVLTGGCFQNKYLLEHAVQRLAAEGFRPYWHQRIPPNDGGIALGQIVAASWERRRLTEGTSALPGKTE
jgi:hydrogenase maturation protein HypF